jgi:hypothetical protein
METEHKYPKILPIIKFDDRTWFVDERSGEFSQLWPPHRRVPFHSQQGALMLRTYAMYGRP